MERNAWSNGAKTAEPMGMSNPIAERDAVLCMNIGAARILVDDSCAKPASSGNVSRSQGTWSAGTWSVGASERSERGRYCCIATRRGGHGGNAARNKLGVTTCKSIFQFLRIQYIKVHP